MSPMLHAALWYADLVVDIDGAHLRSHSILESIAFELKVRGILDYARGRGWFSRVRAHEIVRIHAHDLNTDNQRQACPNPNRDRQRAEARQ